MIAVILAGGFGTRLRSVVSDLPKPLAPVNGRYFLEYLVDHLKTNGMRDFIFCVHYMADKIISHFGNGENFGVRIRYSVEDNPLGTGGSIGLCRELLNETFCVLNADTYLQFDIQELIFRHHTNQALLSMAVTHMQKTGRYGQVQLDADGRIHAFLEKAESTRQGYINAGFYVMEPQILDYIPQGRQISLENDIFPKLLIRDEKIMSFSEVHDFFDIGIPEDYFRFQQWMAEKK